MIGAPARLQPQRGEMLASIIIPTYNRIDSLKRTLQALLEHTDKWPQCEILVVDNTVAKSAELCVQAFRGSRSDWLHYLHEPRPGLHHARHVGANAARGEILVYLDDDVVVESGWLPAMVAPFETYAHVGCVGGKILPQWDSEVPDWVSQQFDLAYLSLLDLGNVMREISWSEGAYGCNLAIRRTLLYDVDGFHPDAIGDRKLIWLRGDGESGLLKKISQAGYSILYAPEAVVYHCIPASRLTMEYFCWRSFIQGISDSYSHIRAYPGRRSMVKQAWNCLLQGIRCYCHTFSEPHNRKMKAEAWYWYGRGQHQLRVIFNRKLRQHVLQATYLTTGKDQFIGRD